MVMSMIVGCVCGGLPIDHLKLSSTLKKSRIRGRSRLSAVVFARTVFT